MSLEGADDKNYVLRALHWPLPSPVLNTQIPATRPWLRATGEALAGGTVTTLRESPHMGMASPIKAKPPRAPRELVGCRERPLRHTECVFPDMTCWGSGTVLDAGTQKRIS